MVETNKQLVERLMSLSKEHDGDLNKTEVAKMNKTQLEDLIETYTQPMDIPEPVVSPEPPKVTPPKGLMTFGDTAVNPTTGETITLPKPLVVEETSDKIGYIQAQGPNKVGFPMEIKALHKGLYYHPVNCKHQQNQLSKGHQYHLELLGASLTNKFDSESKDDFILDTDWIAWFKSIGAAMIGNFSKAARDSKFVEAYKAFHEKYFKR